MPGTVPVEDHSRKAPKSRCRMEDVVGEPERLGLHLVWWCSREEKSIDHLTQVGDMPVVLSKLLIKDEHDWLALAAGMDMITSHPQPLWMSYPTSHTCNHSDSILVSVVCTIDHLLLLLK